MKKYLVIFLITSHGVLYTCCFSEGPLTAKRKKISNAVYWQKKKTLAALLKDKRVPIDLNYTSVGSDIENTFGWKNIIGLKIGQEDPLSPLEAAMFIRKDIGTTELLLTHGAKPSRTHFDALCNQQNYGCLNLMLAHQAVPLEWAEINVMVYRDPHALILVSHRKDANTAVIDKLARKLIEIDAASRPLIEHLLLPDNTTISATHNETEEKKEPILIEV